MMTETGERMAGLLLFTLLGFFLGGIFGTSLFEQRLRQNKPDQIRVTGDDFDAYFQIPTDGLALTEFFERYPILGGIATIQLIRRGSESWRNTTIHLPGGHLPSEIDEVSELHLGPDDQLWLFRNRSSH